MISEGMESYGPLLFFTDDFVHAQSYGHAGTVLRFRWPGGSVFDAESYGFDGAIEHWTRKHISVAELEWFDPKWPGWRPLLEWGR